MIVDVEMLQMMSEFLEQMSIQDEDLAFEAIADVGSGGHFFGTQHTIERYDTAFYSPVVSDWSNFESWQEKGSQNSTQRANRIWKQALSDYQTPYTEPSVVEALEEYVLKKKEE